MRAISGFLRVDLIGVRPTGIVPRTRVWAFALAIVLAACAWLSAAVAALAAVHAR